MPLRWRSAASSRTPAAAIDLIAIGKLPGTGSDYSGLSGTLENGTRGDLLGGIGSGLAWAGGSTFLALPDRGPNAVAWNASIDNTTSYVPRFHTLNLDLVQQADAATGLPFTLVRRRCCARRCSTATRPLNYGGVVAGYGAQPAINRPRPPLLHGPLRQLRAARPRPTRATRASIPRAFASRATATASTSPTSTARTSTSSIAAAASASARSSCRRLLAIAVKAPTGAAEISGNTTGRVANKGMEGLAISPDGKTLFGFVQSPLIQDGGDGGRANRIVTIDIETGTTTHTSTTTTSPTRARPTTAASCWP